MSEITPELISFNVCPFVQRSAITLIQKGVNFNTTYVDLKNLPDWFAEVSPLGKVPVLRIGDTTVFESAVIAEYLDEQYAPQLHPTDLLAKAHHRSWTEFASDITMNMFMMLHKPDEASFNEQKELVKNQLAQVENEIDETGPFFAGNECSLVDASYAPIFLRLKLIDDLYTLDIFDSNGRIAQWSNALLELDSVKNSVVDDFSEIFIDYTRQAGGYIGQQI